MDNVLRLIIIDDNPNDAEKMISTIKSGGFAVRAQRAEDEEDLTGALNTHDPDMLLFALESEHINLEQIIGCIAPTDNPIPVIVVSNDTDGNAVDYLQQGAYDLVAKTQPDHLKLVVSRAASYQFQREQLQKAQAALAESEERNRTLLDSSRDAICYVHEGMHIYGNDSYLELFGYPSFDELEGMPLMDMVAPDDQKTVKDFLRTHDESSEEKQALEINLLHASGDVFSGKLEFSPASVEGEPCTQIVIRNQQNSGELEEQLKRLSQRDAATGLYNRKHFLDKLEAAIQQAIKGQRDSALLHIEVYNMQDAKKIMGLAASDNVLAEIGKLLQKHCDKTDIIGRFSEQTITIISHNAELGQLKEHGKTLSKLIEDHVCSATGKTFKAKACLGAVLIDKDTPTSEELLERARKASQDCLDSKAKEISIYTPDEDEMSQRQIDALWNGRIREALKDNRFDLLFQPIVSLQGDPSERYDLFMEMLDENGKRVPTGEFMGSAERTGFTKALDRWVIMNGLNRLSELHHSGRETTFFFRLSAASVNDQALLQWVSDQLMKTKVSPAHVIFTIKENVIVNHLNHAKYLSDGLKKINCRIALDDFGAGSEPFQLLKTVDADCLKIDHGLMKDITENTEHQQTLRMISETAKEMGKLTIAQHVEDANALSVLWGMSVNYIQGNFLQEPSKNLNYDFSAMG